mgnify:CR=1 FL=1
MRRNGLRAMQNDQIDKGGLKISVVSSNRNRPIANARIEITYTGDPERIVERLITDENGQIPEIELSAPPIEYSMTPSEYFGLRLMSLNQLQFQVQKFCLRLLHFKR